MKKVTVREVRQALTHLDDLLAKEGEVTITRRGQPIARLLPVAGKAAIPSHRALRERMARMAKPSERLLREDRDAR